MSAAPSSCSDDVVMEVQNINQRAVNKVVLTLGPLHYDQEILFDLKKAFMNPSISFFFLATTTIVFVFI